MDSSVQVTGEENHLGPAWGLLTYSPRLKTNENPQKDCQPLVAATLRNPECTNTSNTFCFPMEVSWRSKESNSLIRRLGLLLIKPHPGVNQPKIKNTWRKIMHPSWLYRAGFSCYYFLNMQFNKHLYLMRYYRNLGWLKGHGEWAWVMCIYCALLHTGPENPWILLTRALITNPQWHWGTNVPLQNGSKVGRGGLESSTYCHSSIVITI